MSRTVVNRSEINPIDNVKPIPIRLIKLPLMSPEIAPAIPTRLSRNPTTDSLTAPVNALEVQMIMAKYVNDIKKAVVALQLLLGPAKIIVRVSGLLVGSAQ